jgi:hypothetical protein
MPMTYVLVSRDPRSGIEARIAVPTQALARRAGARELDDGRDLVSIQSTACEWPVTVEEIVMARAVRAGWRRLQGRDGTALAPAHLRARPRAPSDVLSRRVAYDHMAPS